MKRRIYIIGYWSGLIAFLATLAFYIVQMLQIWRVLTYPMDAILIYGFSLCITLPFLIEMLALHHTVPDEKKFWSHAALIFTIVYVVFVTANYVVQLATVIPMTLQGTAEEVKLLTQTPHSLFWDFDAIGYIFMGLATFIAIPIFEKQGIQKWVRYSFMAHTLTTPLIAFVYFYPHFSERLLLIATPWAITAPVFMILLAIMLKREIGKKVSH